MFDMDVDEVIKKVLFNLLINTVGFIFDSAGPISAGVFYFACKCIFSVNC